MNMVITILIIIDSVDTNIEGINEKVDAVSILT
nr:MAG TPA: hypothetical protein [Caudoviricetes sp.]